MADKWHDNETTEPGRFGFASSSLRDALKAVAGLREPATQPAETMADTPMQQPAPMPEPRPVPQTRAIEPENRPDNRTVLLDQQVVSSEPHAAPQPQVVPRQSEQTILRRPVPTAPPQAAPINEQQEAISLPTMAPVLETPPQPTSDTVELITEVPAAAEVAPPPSMGQTSAQEEAERPVQDQELNPTERHGQAVRVESGADMQEQRPTDPIDDDGKTRVVRGVQRPDRNDYYQEPVVAWLVVIGGPGLGAFRPVYEGNNAIGRAQSQRIAIDFGDDSISAEEQAYIRYDSTDRGFLFVPNLAKTNVVSLNETKPTTAVPLAPMDVITVGQTQLVFVPFCGPEFDWSELKEIQSEATK